MLWFWYFSVLLAVGLFIINLCIQINRSTRKNKLNSYKRFKISLLKNLFFSCFLIIAIPTVLPLIIWNTGAKEIQVVEKIENRDELSPLPNKGKDDYLGQYTSDGKNLYVINIGTLNKASFDTFNADLVEVVHSTEITPKCDKIRLYKMSRLKKSNFLYNAVNDMYANIYLRYDITNPPTTDETGKKINENYVGEKIKVYIPNNTMAVNYTVDALK